MDKFTGTENGCRLGWRRASGTAAADERQNEESVTLSVMTVGQLLGTLNLGPSHANG